MKAIVSGVLMAAALLPAPALAQRAAPASFDAWGYLMRQSPHAACPSAWIDLGTGTPLGLVAAGDADADDDGGAEIALPLPFRFYGEEQAALVVSSNGYLAFAENLDAEDGGHWRADCPLPAIPDNRHARFARVYALLADLERGPAGDLRWAHFAQCPRPAAHGADACTVVQWQDWKRRGADGFVDMQVVLYHAHREIAVQYGALDAAATADATFGIQDGGASSALLAGCGNAAPPPAFGAVCYFDGAPTVQIVTAAEPAEAGETSGAGTHVVGDSVTVVATSNPGYAFIDWREDGVPQSNTANYTFTGTTSRNLVARFAAGGDTIFTHGFDPAPDP